jgi:hypothetical protein
MDPLLSVDEARAKKEKLMKELEDAQKQEDEAKQRAALLLAQNLDAQGLHAANARADVAEQLAQTQQARILELTARNTSLEEDLLRLQTEQNNLASENQSLGTIVISVAEELSQGIDDIDQLVQKASTTVGNMRASRLLLQPVVEHYQRLAPASRAAPVRSEVLSAAPNLSLARTAGSSHLRTCCSC